MKRFKRTESRSPAVSLPYVFGLILAVCVMFFALHLSATAQEVVNIPDPNLRAAIENALGKDAGAIITKAEMETLTTLRGDFANISNLSGIEAATNLTWLVLNNNDLSDITPLSSLTNLTNLNLYNNDLSDIAPLSGLTNLTWLRLSSNELSDITPLSGLTNLTWLSLYNNALSDITPLSGLTNLMNLSLYNNDLSDIMPLSGLTNLTNLNLNNNALSDISALAGLTNLENLSLENNQVSDVSALVGLTNLRLLYLTNNQVSDRDTLAALIAQTVVYFQGNLAFETPGPKIEGPWLWTIAPTDEQNGSTAASSGKDYLSEASGGAMTEAYIAANGATAGSVVGDSMWTPGTLPPTGDNNIIGLLITLGLRIDINTPVAYGVVSVESPREQDTRLYVGNGVPVKVWLNGELVHVDVFGRYSANDYLTAFRVTLNQGENRLFVAIYRSYFSPWSGFFGFEDGTEYTLLEPQQTLPADVNADGSVNIQDLVLVAANFGETGENVADVNGDGVVNIQDLVLVAAAFGDTAAAPSTWIRNMEGIPTRTTLQQWIAQAQQLNLTDTTSQRGIEFLEQLLAALTPKETALLPNYPNPFNPETWIPYHLAEPAEVTVAIHTADGKLVRTLALGNQRAGIYQSRSRAAYWDGKNEVSEPVASGIYFYTLTAGDFTATKKMLIRK